MCNIDILMVSETKLDESFLVNQFIIKGFGVSYWIDRNANGGRIALFIREGKTCYYRKFSIQGFFIEIV